MSLGQGVTRSVIPRDYRKTQIVRVACMTVGVVLTLASLAEPQVTFKAGVYTVATYVTVVGSGGEIVRNLSVDDFEVLDDGKPQRITLFQAGSLPVTIAVLLDDSPSLRAAKDRTESAVSEFVRRLLPGDRACVGTFNRTVNLDTRLTGDTTELLDRLHASTSLPLRAGTVLWDAIGAGMSALEQEGGRRVVLVLTDGDDNSSETTASDVETRAARDGPMIYAIGVRGADERLSNSLRNIAGATGGAYFELKPKDNVGSTFRRVADELHMQYLVGFSPAGLDGKTHRLEVRVKRPRMTARARRSYVASPASVPGVDR